MEFTRSSFWDIYCWASLSNDCSSTFSWFFCKGEMQWWLSGIELWGKLGDFTMLLVLCKFKASFGTKFEDCCLLGCALGITSIGAFWIVFSSAAGSERLTSLVLTELLWETSFIEEWPKFLTLIKVFFVETFLTIDSLFVSFFCRVN